MTKYLRVGKIITTHGINGGLKVFPTTNDVRRFDKLNKVFLHKKDEASDNEIDCNNSFKIESVKYVKNCPIVKLENIDSIESSQIFISNSIYIERADAVDLKPNEYFITDLIGIDIIVDGKTIGNVCDIIETKANSIIVTKINNKEVLIPFVNDFVESVDIANKKIFVKTIEGLL